MLVSVVIPTYNSSRFITESIQSVLAQTVTDLEVIVVDDGSTDDTQTVLASITDPRVKVLRIQNQGIGAARSAGVEHAQGRFVAFNDADDLWRPQKLEKQLAIMECEPEVGVIFTDFVRFSTEGVYPQTQFEFFPELASVKSTTTRCGVGRRVLGDPFLEFIRFSQFPAWIQTMLFRAESIQGIRFLCERGLTTDDMYYCFKVYERTGAAYIPEPLADVRRHDSNSTLDLARLEHDVRKVLCVLEKEIREPARLESLRRRIGRAWNDSGDMFVLQHRPIGAVKAYAEAFRYPGARLGALKRLATLPIREYQLGR